MHGTSSVSRSHIELFLSQISTYSDILSLVHRIYKVYWYYISPLDMWEKQIEFQRQCIFESILKLASPQFYQSDQRTPLKLWTVCNPKLDKLAHRLLNQSFNLLTSSAFQSKLLYVAYSRIMMVGYSQSGWGWIEVGFGCDLLSQGLKGITDI